MERSFVRMELCLSHGKGFGFNVRRLVEISFHRFFSYHSTLLFQALLFPMHHKNPLQQYIERLHIDIRNISIQLEEPATVSATARTMY